jgi:hypothetical protein
MTVAIPEAAALAEGGGASAGAAEGASGAGAGARGATATNVRFVKGSGSGSGSGGGGTVAKRAAGNAGGSAAGSAGGNATGSALGARHRKHKAERAAKRAARDTRSPGGAGFTPRRALVAEFVLCALIASLMPIVNTSMGAKDFMKRETAIAALFLVLGLVSTGGRGPAKVAVAFGGLVTLVLLVNDRDLFTYVARALSKTTGDSGGTDTGKASPAPANPPDAGQPPTPFPVFPGGTVTPGG